jgi:hypothetical protein
MINICIAIIYSLLLILSVIKCFKVKDKDHKVCWILSGLLWLILIITNIVVATL